MDEHADPENPSRPVPVLVAEQIARGMGYLAIGAGVFAWIWTGNGFDMGAVLITGAFVTMITSGGHILDHLL